MKLENKVAIVTGGGRGIGKEIALAFAREGANVLVCGRTRDVLDRTANEINSIGQRSVAIVSDVTDEMQVAEMVNVAVSRLGHIDILVNNAGIAGPTSAITAVSRASWDDTIAANLTSAFLCSRAVIPVMIKRRSGKIINISSVAGKTAYALRSPYAAAKWGMIGLSVTLAEELGGHNIQVNAICPGPTAGERMTSVIAHRAKELGLSEAEMEQAFVAKTALKRMADPKHVAAAALFFASEDSGSVTGEVLEVSSGYAL